MKRSPRPSLASRILLALFLAMLAFTFVFGMWALSRPDAGRWLLPH